MNNAKSFIVIALILGTIAAVVQVFFTFFAGKTTGNAITADSIQLLPATINVEQLTTFTDRAEKYLILTPKQFEDGVDPTGLDPNATPSVTPIPTP